MQLLGSLKVLVLGLGAAFAGLSLLIIFIELMHKVVNNKKEENNDSPSPKEVSQNTGHVVESNNNTAVEEDDSELIAVIAAAVAAALNRSTHDIIVRSVRRIQPHSPVWNRTGRQEQIRTRL